MTTLINTIAAVQEVFAGILKELIRMVKIETFSGKLGINITILLPSHYTEFLKQSSLLCDTAHCIYWSCHLC